MSELYELQASWFIRRDQMYSQTSTNSHLCYIHVQYSLNA